MKMNEHELWLSRRLDELTRENENLKRQIQTLNAVAVQRSADFERLRARHTRLVDAVNNIHRIAKDVPTVVS